MGIPQVVLSDGEHDRGMSRWGSAVVGFAAVWLMTGCSAGPALSAGGGAEAPGTYSADTGVPTALPSASTFGAEYGRERGPEVLDVRWVQREGVRALRVTPAPRLRHSGDVRAYEEAWREVLASAPEAGTVGMRDQFVCHAEFAPAKAAWFLEPDRPAVGYWETVRAGCNPGNLRDVG